MPSLDSDSVGVVLFTVIAVCIMILCVAAGASIAGATKELPKEGGLWMWMCKCGRVERIHISRKADGTLDVRRYYDEEATRGQPPWPDGFPERRP